MAKNKTKKITKLNSFAELLPLKNTLSFQEKNKQQNLSTTKK